MLIIYTIIKNTARYSGIGKEFPKEFKVYGLTLEQAIKLAKKLSDHEAGCQYAYYCKEDEEAI